MYLFKICLNYALILIFIKNYSEAANVKNKAITKISFGPYYASTRSLENCPSTSMQIDKENMANVSAKVYKKTRALEEYRANITVPADVKIVKGRLSAYVKSNGGFHPELVKNINHPCKNILFSKMFINDFKTNDKCEIKKGLYKIEGGSTNDQLHVLFKEFHYVTVAFDMEWFSKNGVVYCTRVIVDIKPLKTN